jgi:aryl-alcohol dehydrogenase-like predicted oxidoreductase
MMEYTKLGSTGLDVSRLCLGCMSFGIPERGGMPWVLDQDGSNRLFKQAVEAGINFFDTANGYSAGTSEEIVGRAIKEYCSDRDAIVLATKVFMPMRLGPNGGGLLRKAILAELDASLRRLDVDYIDLYQIHRWDDHTPIEETMRALDDVVRAGKVRYIGASTMYAWQFSKAQYVARAQGWTEFVSMQSQYNLLCREEEREMFPLCADQGIGLIPWSPLARGRLTRPWTETSLRGDTDERSHTLYRDTDGDIVDEVATVAEARGVSPAQVALAWVTGNPQVDAAIVGATKEAHLTDAVNSLNITLTPEETHRLEAKYRTREFAS